MKLWLPGIVAVCLLSAAAVPAQEPEQPLGDVARNVRKSRAQQLQSEEDRPVIDNENIDQVSEELKSRKPASNDKFVLSMDPSGKTIRASSPDVSCSLSFNARAGALLVKPVLMETLPLQELIKLDGPASIQEETLQLEVFNGTEWELREITVGLTLERKPGANAELAARAYVIPAAQTSIVTVEKRSDVTLLYHLKATAKPFSTTTFKENIGITPGPDEDWRWSIVEAKGIRSAEVVVPPEGLPPASSFDLPTPLAPDPAQNPPTPPGTTTSQGSTVYGPSPLIPQR